MGFSTKTANLDLIHLKSFLLLHPDCAKILLFISGKKESNIEKYDAFDCNQKYHKTNNKKELEKMTNYSLVLFFRGKD